jgi:hypothetical protein
MVQPLPSRNYPSRSKACQSAKILALAGEALQKSPILTVWCSQGAQSERTEVVGLSPPLRSNPPLSGNLSIAGDAWQRSHDQHFGEIIGNER